MSDRHVTRCPRCGDWKFHHAPCPTCETHTPTYYIDERRDVAYRICALCGRGWPCAEQDDLT